VVVHCSGANSNNDAENMPLIGIPAMHLVGIIKQKITQGRPIEAQSTKVIESDAASSY
jgi:hypothetical protein